MLNKFVSQGVNDSTGVFQFMSSKGTTSNPTAQTDYHVIGNLDPKFYGGLSNTFTYKSFQLDVFLQYTKQLGPNYFQQIYGSGPVGKNVNLPAAFLNNWQNIGDHTNIEKFSTQYSSAYSAGSDFSISSGAYSDASYIRFKTIAISYNLQGSYLKKAKIEACRIYLNAQNLFTITNYKGNDPENKSFYSLPPLRTIVGGIQITF
jgi:hypothetical protein